ncbi:hypothetical protein E2C01_009179 [Portunus trituberculatus]|uniref:Uncharacterized protein n=1 Tax=Portunus trituberculatus TaxID=210409 RepID=A0A5B7D5C5_PORTR|nr:hypothetical protein [Portunus trituberculatus]
MQKNGRQSLEAIDRLKPSRLHSTTPPLYSTSPPSPSQRVVFCLAYHSATPPLHSTSPPSPSQRAVFCLAYHSATPLPLTPPVHFHSIIPHADLFVLFSLPSHASSSTSHSTTSILLLFHMLTCFPVLFTTLRILFHLPFHLVTSTAAPHPELFTTNVLFFLQGSSHHLNISLSPQHDL